MIITRLMGTRAHLEYCYSFIQFEAFGAMHILNAITHFEEGTIEEEEVSMLPLSNPFKVIKLTGKGRKASRAQHKIWNNFYLPSFEDPDYKLIDEYSSNSASNNTNAYALSFERFQKERNAGRVNEMLLKCPPMSEYRKRLVNPTLQR